MSSKVIPDLAKLKASYTYDRKSGLFFHLKNSGRASAGAIAGSKRPDGHIKINLGGKSYLAHKLAYYYIKGYWPSEIDHKNGRRADNRLSNLRPAKRFQNNGNSKGWGAKKRSRLPRGVYFHPADKSRYRAQVMIAHKAVHLGCFNTVDEARAAYATAAEKHFGEFAHD